MRILALESSCDESAAAVLDSAGGLLAHELFSQVELHRIYGGVVPELASRDHVHKLLPLVRSALAAARTEPGDLDGVAYTAGPGLIGALLTGAALARSLAFAWGVPAIGVHHLEGHLLAPLLEDEPPPFPHVALLVSGGHTMLIQVQGIGHYQRLGESRDDAAGEAFDKTAKLLGLPYPGGPELARMADAAKGGVFNFPRPMLDRPGLEFSFSGLKTAVLHAVRGQAGAGQAGVAQAGVGQAEGGAGAPKGGAARPKDAQMLSGGQFKAGVAHPVNAQALSSQFKADVAHAVQEAIVETLVAKSLRALEQTGLDDLVVSGGVSANRTLRARLAEVVSKRGGRVYYPRIEFCTDNAAMIAVAGLARLTAGQHDGLAIKARAQWPLESLSPL